MGKNNIDRFTYKVLPHETDLNRGMTPYNIGSFALDCAGEAANARGFSMRYLQEHGFTWVVSRMSVEMDEYPKEFTEMDIETWVASVSKVASNRNFHIYNQEGKHVGCATSLWSIIDFNTRKLANLTEIFTDMEKHVAENEFALKPARVDIPMEMTANIKAVHKVRYSDIDMNHHTNSMRYVQWVLDLMDINDIEGKLIRRFDINFVTETLFGDTVEIEGYRKETETGVIYAFVLKKGETVCCKIKMVLQEKN